jgi:uncharacterized protein (DUF1501 family)
MQYDPTSKAHGACDEYSTLSRRGFLGAAAAASVPMWMPRVALGAPGGGAGQGRDVLVFVFLRGGTDMLSAVVPFGDAALYTARPTLAIPAGQVTSLDGFFGLAPALAPLHRAYVDQKLAFVHAAGSTDPTRSHFDAMARIETATPNAPTAAFDGWLARHLLNIGALGTGQLRGLALGDLLPRMLAGAPASLPVADPAAFGFPGDPLTAGARRATLEAMYARAAPPIGPAAANALATIDLLDAIDFMNYQPANGASYPASNLGGALASTAAMLKHGLDLEAVTYDYGGWDHHANMGPLTGTLAGMLNDLALGLDAFELDMRASGARWTLVVQSEFGRRVAQNGSLGTDHGHGSCLFVMGDGIAGGQVFARWPGLAPGQLDQGDLAVTTDYRNVLAEILVNRMGATNLGALFPGFTPTTIGVTI